MTCANCHTPLPDDAAFCPNCGTTRPAPASSTLPAGHRAMPPVGGMRTFSGQSTIAPMRERDTATLEPGTRFAERYEVVKKIGAGGMGVVYLATDTHTGQELVLKLIHPDLVNGEDAMKRLMAEGLTARQIRHPKIVAVYDVALYDDQPYFTMEYVRGGSLRSWESGHMASGQDVPLATAAGLIKSMLAGINEAHRMGIVHRDLKPENVLLVGNPDEGNFDLKILDFGIAKAVGTPRTASGGGPMGTPLYMAPEQMTAAETVGPAADIYSLGVMFYELLMEAPPQGRWEPVSKSRPDVPKAIDDLIEKALSVRPRSRPASAAEFETLLDTAMATVKAPEPVPPPRPPDNVVPQPVVVVPEPPPQPPQPPPFPPDPPPPVRGNMWANLSPKAKLVIYGIAAFVVIGMIGNMMDSPTTPADTDGDGIVDTVDACPSTPGVAANDGCPAQPVPPPAPAPVPAPQPPPAPPPRTARTERWRDDAGNIYTVRRNGANFDGSAENVSVNGVFYGHVDMAGAVSPSGGTIVMTNGNGIVYQSPIGATGPGTDPRTTDALFGTLRFHIDH